MIPELAPLAAAGFATVVAQTALLREIIVVCQGNELTVGLALAGWLAGGAAGSWSASRSGRSPASGFPLALSLLALLALPALLGVRGFKLAAGLLPGQSVSPGNAALLAAVAMAPVGAAAGAVYAGGARWLEERRVARPAGSAYWAEAAGFVAGGVAFTMGATLLPAIGAVAVAALVAAAAALCAEPRPGVRIAAATLIVVLLGVIPAGGPLERTTMGWLFPGSTVVRTAESHYGRTVVAAAGGQTTVYHNGWPVASRPDALTPEDETTIALGLLCADRPRRVLLLGGAELLPALMDQDLGSVTYVEVDPVLIHAIARPAAGRAALRTVPVDGRRFIEAGGERFDAILVGIPYTATLSTNRYYTVEFMTAARRRLTDGGVLVYGMPGAETARDRYKEALGATIEATMARAFEQHAVFRGNRDILIGRNGSPVPAAGAIVDRSAAAGLRLPTLTRESLRHRLAIAQGLATVPSRASLNHDRRPAALVAGLLLWQSVLSRGTARAFQAASRVHPLWWLVAAALIPWRRRRREGTAFSAGAAAMGLQMLCLWGLQIRQGDLYQWLAASNALFMAGTALGAYAAARSAAGRVRVIAVDAAFCAWAGLFLLVNTAMTAAGWTYLAGSAVTGILLGSEFTLLAAAGPGEGRTAGPLYAADLLGGALAALWIGALAMPAWGLAASAGAVAAIKLISLPWWALRGATDECR
jgi:spermidine synthase